MHACRVGRYNNNSCYCNFSYLMYHLNLRDVVFLFICVIHLSNGTGRVIQEHMIHQSSLDLPFSFIMVSVLNLMKDSSLEPD